MKEPKQPELLEIETHRQDAIKALRRTETMLRKKLAEIQASLSALGVRARPHSRQTGGNEIVADYLDMIGYGLTIEDIIVALRTEYPDRDFKKSILDDVHYETRKDPKKKGKHLLKKVGDLIGLAGWEDEKFKSG